MASAGCLRGVLSRTRPCRGSGRLGLRSRRGRDRHCGCFGAKFKVASCELVESTLVLKEDNLAIGLAPKLHASSHLRHRSVAHIPAFRVHAPLAVRTADDEARLAYRGKHRVTIGILEELRALDGFSEDVNGALGNRPLGMLKRRTRARRRQG